MTAVNSDVLTVLLQTKVGVLPQFTLTTGAPISGILIEGRTNTGRWYPLVDSQIDFTNHTWPVKWVSTPNRQVIGAGGTVSFVLDSTGFTEMRVSASSHTPLATMGCSVISQNYTSPTPTPASTIMLVGDSITHNNFLQRTITSISRTAGIVTAVCSSNVGFGPGGNVQVVGVAEDMRGNQTVLTTSGATFTYASPGPDGAGVLYGFPRVADMLEYADTGIFTWANILMRQKFDIVGVSASTGRYTDEALARVNEVIANMPAYAFCMIGTNDVADSEAGHPLATSIANVRALYLALTGVGINVLACTIPPQGAPAWNATTTDRVVRFNEAVRAMAASIPGVTLVDVHAAMVDPMAANKGMAKAGYMITNDGLHPAPRGCYRAGKRVASDLAGIKFIDKLVTNSADNYGTSTASSNLLDSAPWVNSGGTVTAPATGTAATGWNFQRAGAAVPTIAPVARADGYGYDHVVTLTPTAANDGFTLYTPGFQARLPVSGPISFQLLVEVSAANMNAANINTINAYFSTTLGGVSNRIITSLASIGSSIAESVDEDWVGVLATPKMSLSLVPSTISLNIQAFATAASASTATFKFGRASIRYFNS